MGALYLFNIVQESIAKAIRQQKEIKKIQIGKEEAKILLFSDDIIYMRPKSPTKEHLQLINIFSNVAKTKLT